MTVAPSSALAGAAVAAQGLAQVLTTLAATLPGPSDTAQAVTATARRLAQVAAPRIGGVADVGEIAASFIGAAQTLARACAPGDAASALYEAAAATRSCTPTSASPVLTRAYGLARALCASVEAACLGEAFLCEARTPFGSRQAASQARDRITLALEGALDRIAAALGQAAAVVLSTAAAQTCAHLADAAGTLQPLVLVQTGRSVPSSQVAWSLYADPARAAELIALNGIGTPMFMPTSFEALSPGGNR